MKLRKRQESAERQNQSRDEVLGDLRAAAEESPESEIWIDDHFQPVLKNLVHSLIEAENQLFGLQERRQRLESSKSDGKVPSGLKIRSVTAKGRNAENLQAKFNIIKEAKLKLLDATIEALHNEEQQAKERCTEEKQNIVTAIESWKGSFQSSDSSLDIEADEFVKSAKLFADNYFECATTRASKRVVENIKKASKEAKRTERMETEFIPNEQSIRDMVDRAVRQEVSKLCPIPPPGKITQPPRKSSKSRGKDRSTTKNGKHRRRNPSHDARNNSSPPAKGAQGRRSRSKQWRGPSTSRKPGVSFSVSRSPSVSRRRQQSKNGRGCGSGAVK